LSNGDVRQIYRQEQGLFQRVPGFWNDYLQTERPANFSVQPMFPRRLFFEKTVLETPASGKEIKRAQKTSELKNLFASLSSHESASLVHIQWGKAEAFVLVPGSNLPLRQAIFSDQQLTEEDAAGLIQTQNHTEAQCDLTIYRGGFESEAWLELHLKVLFEWFCNQMLTQYGYLTGRVMVTFVVQNLMIFASQSGWDLKRIGNELVDQTIFPSSVATGDAYRDMLALVSQRLAVMVGPTLSQSVKQQSLATTNLFYQSLIKMYELID
jgi:hypothetical protein